MMHFVAMAVNNPIRINPPLIFPQAGGVSKPDYSPTDLSFVILANGEMKTKSLSFWCP
jgi:hypothetical protein